MGKRSSSDYTAMFTPKSIWFSNEAHHIENQGETSQRGQLINQLDQWAQQTLQEFSNKNNNCVGIQS